MASNVALTIQSANESNLGSRISIGSNLLSLDYSKSNLYWMVVLDRSDLSVKENFTFSDNSTVPAQLKPYLNNNQYILVLATQMLNSSNLPQGALYSYLVGEGAGTGLLTLERIFQAFNCGNWGWMGYVYVAIMGDDTTNGFESYTVQNPAAFLALNLVPFNIGGTTLYTPTSISGSIQ